MKETKYIKVQRALTYAASDLEKMRQERKDLPQMFKERLYQLREEMKGHDLEQYREAITTPTGEVLTVQQVLEIVKQASGYTKWTAETYDAEAADMMGTDREQFRDKFGLDVKKVEVYGIERSVRNRDLVYRLQFSCIPGMVHVSYQTDRAGIDFDAPTPNDKLSQALIREVFDE